MSEERDRKAFWAAIKKSADLVRGMPAWTQGGIVLSHNFTGPHASKEPPPREDPEYWQDVGEGY